MHERHTTPSSLPPQLACPLNRRRSRPPRSFSTALVIALIASTTLGWAIPDSLAAQLDRPDTRSEQLRPGDMLRIQVWRQPEFSGEFFITDDGFIGHPLFRSIYAINRPISAVEDALRLFLLDFESEPNFVMEPFFQVAVGGQVRQPNVHPLRPGTTVAEAVAMAGGVTDEGRLDRVILRRGGDQFRVDLTDAAGTARLTPIRSGDEIVVERRPNVFREYILPFVYATGSILSIANFIMNHG